MVDKQACSFCGGVDSNRNMWRLYFPLSFRNRWGNPVRICKRCAPNILKLAGLVLNDSADWAVPEGFVSEAKRVAEKMFIESEKRIKKDLPDL